MNMKRYLTLSVILLGLALMVNPAMATITDPFTGGGSVTSGTDTLGNTWLTQVVPQDVTGTQIIMWGVPGYSQGTVSPAFTGTITDFHFSTLPESGTGDQFQILDTSQSVGGLTTETRFQVDNVLWNRVISTDGYSVDFYAPSLADAITSGVPYFVNIAFKPPPSVTGLSEDDLYFTAHYSQVPLPGGLLLLGAGLVRLGAYGRKRRKAAA